jgi:hypothetical protein
LVDSGVDAGNTAEHMLIGKEFNRDVGGFTLVFEALQVLFIAAFIHWCRTFDQIPKSAFWNALFEFHRSIRDQTIETSVLTKVEELFECEPPDIPVKFLANQHMLSCISSIHARINQKITKTAIGPKFPYRR